ncbi:hypothetical protein M3Y99_00482400 [Aphelenchoides fujianensis]|nr:hypothetical protein M3Y99_00482400 [Aphelenchoides fujianensis]
MPERSNFFAHPTRQRRASGAPHRALTSPTRLFRLVLVGLLLLLCAALGPASAASAAPSTRDLLVASLDFNAAPSPPPRLRAQRSIAEVNAEAIKDAVHSPPPPEVASTSTAAPPQSTLPPPTIEQALGSKETSVQFKRRAFHGDRPFVTTELKDETFRLNSSVDVADLRFECDAELEAGNSSASGSTKTIIPLETFWLDGRSGDVVADGRVLRFDAEAAEALKRSRERRFRCAARLRLPWRGIDSFVQSRSFVLIADQQPHVHLWPLRLNALLHQSLRIECKHNGSLVPSAPPFQWTHNGQPIERADKADGFEIYDVGDRSVLYARNARAAHVGIFGCAVDFADGRRAESATQTEVHVLETAADLAEYPGARGEEIRPDGLLEARFGEDLMLECSRPDVNQTEWFRTNPATKQRERITAGPALIFRAAKLEVSGDYECVMRAADGQNHTRRSHVFIDENFFAAEQVPLTIVRKAQGTPAKLLCRTFPQLNENPSMVEWKRDDVHLNAPLDRLYRRTNAITEGPQQGKTVTFPTVQLEDQGVYKCTVRHGSTHERVQQTLFIVQQMGNDTLFNFRMSVDHKRRCFNSHFDIPTDVNHLIAQKSHYFLYYFSADLQSDLNAVPKSEAKCSTNGSCTVECWTPSFPLQPATEYTFRLSAVFTDFNTIITPLTAAVNATSWDAAADEGVRFDWLHDPAEGRLDLRWQRPNVSGQLVEYHLELVKMDGPNGRASTERKLPRLKLQVDAREQDYMLNLSTPFALKIRLIPITRSGPPPAVALNDARKFGYTLVAAGGEFGESHAADARIPAPNVRIEQVEAAAQLRVYFEQPTDAEHNATSIRVHYRPLSSTRPNSAMESHEVIETDETVQLESDGRKVMTLTDDLKMGMSYQVCAAYERRTEPPVLGFWRCANVPLSTADGRAAAIRSEDAFTNARHLLPRPVDCGKAATGCRCTQSRNDHDLMEIRWKTAATAPKAPGRDFGLPFHRNDPQVTYRLHYTLNETDPAMERSTVMSRLFYAGTETVMELRGLFPQLPYRVMIEAQSEQGHAVEGEFFTCLTPKDLHLPPPAAGEVSVLGGKVAQVQWKPPLPEELLKKMPAFDGYTLHWKGPDSAEHSEFVKGHDVNSAMLTALEPSVDYTAQLSSHSSMTGDSPLRSKPFVVRIPGPEGDTNAPNSDPLHRMLSGKTMDGKTGVRATKKPPVAGEWPPINDAKPKPPVVEDDPLTRLRLADANLPWYRTFRFRAFALLFVVAVLIICCCVLLSVCVSEKYFDWRQRRAENRGGFARRKREAEDENALMSAIAFHSAHGHLGGLVNGGRRGAGGSDDDGDAHSMTADDIAAAIHVKRDPQPRRSSTAAAASHSARSHLLAEAAGRVHHQQHHKSAFSRFSLRKKKRAVPSGLSSGRLSAASSRLSLHSLTGDSHPAGSQPSSARHALNGLIAWAKRKTKRDSIETAGYCASDDDDGPRLSIVPRPAVLPQLDPKGGPQGYRPRGQRRVRRMIKDPEFKSKIKEMNADPSGIGKTWREMLDEMKEAQQRAGVLTSRQREEYEANGIPIPPIQRPSLPTPPLMLPYAGEYSGGSMDACNVPSTSRGPWRACRQASNASAPNPSAHTQQPSRQHRQRSRAARSSRHHRPSIGGTDESDGEGPSTSERRQSTTNEDGHRPHASHRHKRREGGERKNRRHSSDQRAHGTSSAARPHRHHRHRRTSANQPAAVEGAHLAAINEPPPRLHKSNSLVDFSEADVNGNGAKTSGLADGRPLESSNSAGNVHAASNGRDAAVAPIVPHFRKRPSLNSLDDFYPPTTASSAAPSELMTPGTPKHFPPLVVEEEATPPCEHSTNGLLEPTAHFATRCERRACGQRAEAAEPRVEFLIGTNGGDEEVRFRLKSAASAKPAEGDAAVKKTSNGTTSMPNLADSGIVYDEVAGHPQHIGLHPITSMKILKLHQDDEDDYQSFAHHSHSDQSHFHSHVPLIAALLPDARCKRAGAERPPTADDQQSAVSTSSGASSRGSAIGSTRDPAEFDADALTHVVVIEANGKDGREFAPQLPHVPLQFGPHLNGSPVHNVALMITGRRAHEEPAERRDESRWLRENV